MGIEFHPGEAPGGSAVLLFAHGGALRLDVECLECELTDLGADDLGTGDLGEGAEPSGWGVRRCHSVGNASLARAHRPHWQIWVWCAHRPGMTKPPYRPG